MNSRAAASLHDHEMGHADSDEERRNQARIFRWYYGQLAYMIERLKSIPEDGGTLFDNTLIVCCSEWGMYNHRSNDVPYVLIGNPGGAFKNKGQYFGRPQRELQAAHGSVPGDLPRSGHGPEQFWRHEQRLQQHSGLSRRAVELLEYSRSEGENCSSALESLSEPS